MGKPLFTDRAAPRRGTFSLFALVSVIALGLLTISILSSNQERKRPATAFEELGDVDLDNAEEVKKLLTSKVQSATTGDQYLSVLPLKLISRSSLPHAYDTPIFTESESARPTSPDLSWKLNSLDTPT